MKKEFDVIVVGELNVDLILNQIESFPEMGKEIEQALYRVAQEALANISRHSRATRVAVEVSCSGHGVVLSIVDDGVGFDETQVSGKGLGLSSMHERMQSVSGQLKIDSQPGKGTRIVASCPLEGGG